MNTFEFTLLFRLPTTSPEPDSHVDALFEAGCDDALIGTGATGSIGLTFNRVAASAEEAMRSAITDVLRAIPSAKLLEAKPDWVNLSDLADVLGCSRQNIRKYASGQIKGISETFPSPSITGSPNLWRLFDLAGWFAAHASLRLPPHIIEAAEAALRINVEVQAKLVGMIRRSDESDDDGFAPSFHELGSFQQAMPRERDFDLCPGMAG